MTSFDGATHHRPARVLIGWMAEEEAVLMQTRRQDEHPRKAEFELRARQARLVASARRPTIEARGVVSEAPADLRKFVASFHTALQPEELEKEGWRIALADLRRVCAVHPSIFTDTELPDVDADDFEALARITLQPPGETGFEVQYHKDRQAWIIPAGPNLKLVDEFQTQVPGGLIGLGFTFRKFGSFLQVVGYRDRYVIRDGNHRALTFLARGINVVPALVTDAMSVQDIHLRRGMLPIDIVLGDRPPLMPDYLDDDVSAEVLLPDARRVYVVQGLDIPVAY
jgi:hypothetical protein